jgi:hypothetical protein
MPAAFFFCAYFRLSFQGQAASVVQTHSRPSPLAPRKSPSPLEKAPRPLPETAAHRISEYQ